MTPMQRRFADEYLVGLDAQEAALKAGYSPKTAAQQGYTLKKIPEIAKYIEQRMKAREIRTEVNQDLVISKVLATIAKAEAEHSPNWAQVVLKGTDQLFQILGSYKQKHEITGADGAPLEMPSVNVIFKTADG